MVQRGCSRRSRGGPVGFKYQHHEFWTGWAAVVTSIGFAATWAVLRGDRAQAPNARLCLLAAILLLLANVGVSWVGPLWVVSTLINTLSAIPIVMLLLRYPYTRIPRRFDRWFVVVLAAWLIIMPVLLIVTWTPIPRPANGGRRWCTATIGRRRSRTPPTSAK